MNNFTSNSTQNPTNLFAGLNKKVSKSMNRSLTRPISDAEIKRAVFSISPFNALGDDGFSTKFYQFYWDLIKTYVLGYKEFFQRRKNVKKLQPHSNMLNPKGKKCNFYESNSAN